MNKETIITVLLIAGLLLLAGGTVLPLFVGLQFVAFRFIYCAGAALLLIARLFSPYKGEDIRLKRLHRLELWSALIFCVGGFFLFYDHGTFQEALAFTLAGAMVQIYATIMIPIVERRSKRQ